jgi:hypothetical protein
VHEELTAALAPYGAGSGAGSGVSAYEPEWDWWYIFGGEGEKALPLIPGRESDSRVIRNPRHRDGTTRKNDPRFCDGAARQLLDIERVESLARLNGEGVWGKLAELSRKFPFAQPLESYLDLSEIDSTYAVAMARRDYLSQPFIVAARELGLVSSSSIPQEVDDPAAWLRMGVEEFTQHCVDRVIPTDCLLTIEGEWLREEQIGHDFTSHRFVRNFNRSKARYLRHASSYIRELPGDAFVVRVLCHS